MITAIRRGTVLLVLAGLPSIAMEVDSEYLEAIDRERGERVEGLTAEGGWLTVVGLHWLEPGVLTLGASPDADVPLPVGKAPERTGTLTVDDEGVRLEAAPGVSFLVDGQAADAARLEDDRGGSPTEVSLGDLTFHLIHRGDRVGVRVKDNSDPRRTEFAGIPYFPTDPTWRVVARLEPHDPPRSLPIPTVLGTVTEAPSAGTVVFERDGQEVRLETIGEADDDALWLIFGDRTNGTDTYGGGRYLYTEKPGEDGTVVIDFNLAYNPPCAFTAYATCPLPPRQNRLSIPVTAGEKKVPSPH